MTPFRPRIVAAAALILLATACSQPSLGPRLEPQFGTAKNDAASVVTTDNQRGRVYLGGSFGEIDYDVSQGNALFFRRYDRAGTLVWQRELQEPTANVYAVPVGADIDSAGNVYYAWTQTRVTGRQGGELATRSRGLVSKLNAAGTLLLQVTVGGALKGMTTDSGGNLYLAVEPAGKAPFLGKYSPAGKPLWRQSYNDPESGRPFDLGGLDVGTDGTLYAAASGGFGDAYLFNLRSTDGKLLVRSEVGGDWSVRPVVGGSSVYVLSELDAPSSHVPIVSKFRTDGSRVWERRGTYGDVGDESFEGASDIGVDSQGNLYLTGWFFSYEVPDYDYFVRKYSPSGSVLLSRVTRLPGTDEAAHAVALGGADELYLVGQTSGKVNGSSSGKDDAFLVRLDGKGNRVWSR